MKLRFTTPADIDGGIGRSVTGERWPFKFMKNPKEPHERKIKTSLKSPEVIKKLMPSLLFVCMKLDKHLVADWDDTLVGPLPRAIQDATYEVLKSDNQDEGQAFMDCVMTTKNKDEALSRFQMIMEITNWSNLTVKLTKPQAEKLFDSLFDGSSRLGGTYMAKMKNSSARGEYLKMNQAALKSLKDAARARADAI